MLRRDVGRFFLSRPVREEAEAVTPLIDLLSGPWIGPRVRSRVDAGFHGYAWYVRSAGVKGPSLIIPK